jgi:hypothetical protein
MFFRRAESEAVSGRDELMMLSFACDLLAFMRARKIWWMAPLLIVLLSFGGLLVLAQGSAVAPFIYTIF